MSRRLPGRLGCRAAILAAVAVSAAACSSSDPPARTVGGVSRSVFSEDAYGVSTSPRVASNDSDIPKGGGTFKLGSPYKVGGRWYVPRENPDYEDFGVASWYGADFHGRRTANGEVFDANALTAAHPTMPLPCYAIVTNLDNGKSVMVRVNDRGPYVNDRIIDMSYAAAKVLGYASKGRARVKVRYAGRAPLNGDDRRERQYLASLQSPPERRYPPVAIASNDDAPPAYDDRRLPAAAYDRWSPIDYRAQLAGKAPPPVSPRPQVASSVPPVDPYDAYSFEDRRITPAKPFAPPKSESGRMSLSAREPDAAFGSDRNYVQVGMFRERSNAERLRRELGALGPVEVAPIQVDDGGEVYRVRVGPFTHAAATRTQGQIAAYGVADTAIVAD